MKLKQIKNDYDLSFVTFLTAITLLLALVWLVSVFMGCEWNGSIDCLTDELEKYHKKKPKSDPDEKDLEA